MKSAGLGPGRPPDFAVAPPGLRHKPGAGEVSRPADDRPIGPGSRRTTERGDRLPGAGGNERVDLVGLGRRPVAELYGDRAERGHEGSEEHLGSQRVGGGEAEEGR